MFKTFLPMLAAGDSSRLEYEDYKKLVQFLQDNPDAMVVLRTKHIMLFCKKPYVNVRRSIWKEVGEFESEFGLKLRLVKSTDTFHICAGLNADAIAEMEQLAVEVSADNQSEMEHICSDFKDAAQSPSKEAEKNSKPKHKAKTRRDEKCTTERFTSSRKRSAKVKTKSLR